MSEDVDFLGTCSYSPEDNKIRFYPFHRLSTEDYSRVKAAGFSWAPKQELFVAPAWSPSREDLMLRLCGEIGDEDTSLVERAEARADRFEDFSDKRSREAGQAKEAVARIADNIPFGQPILVGHHSEKHARKHAEQIENGMRRAVRLWETADYWKSRAAGALSHAKYKERPDVRHRRIKGLESDRRKYIKNKQEAEALLKGWSRQGLNMNEALLIANHDHGYYCFTLTEYPRELPVSQYEGDMGLWSALDHGILTAQQAAALAIPRKHSTIAYCERWIAHLDNRLLYERAMLGEPVADKYDIVVGGRVLIRGEWVTVLRVNKSAGVVNSLTTNRKYVSKVGIEEVKGYEPPSAEQASAAKVFTW